MKDKLIEILFAALERELRAEGETIRTYLIDSLVSTLLILSEEKKDD